MGEIADGVINGDFCERCLNPIEDGLPFPHWCEQCAEENSETMGLEELKDDE